MELKELRICSSYHINPSLWKNLDEIRFSISSIDRALDFATENPDKKVIIEILSMTSGSITKDQIKNITTENANIYFDFYEIADLLDVIDESRKWMYHYPANTYNMLFFLTNLPVSDITINEPLTFDLINLRDVMARNETKINLRVIPANGRPELFNHIRDKDNGLNHFWVLPQHKDLYDQFFDVIDILDVDPVREETLVTLFIKGIYKSEMQYYLKNSESHMPAGLIDDRLVMKRMGCHQTCMQGVDGYKCHFCEAEALMYEQIAKQKELENPIT